VYAAALHTPNIQKVGGSNSNEAGSEIANFGKKEQDIFVGTL
jgi:hypothetical protein